MPVPSEFVAEENEFFSVAIKASEVVKVKVFPAAAKCRVTDFPAKGKRLAGAEPHVNRSTGRPSCIHTENKWCLLFSQEGRSTPPSNWSRVSSSVDQAPLAGLEKPQWITEACNGHGPTAASSHAANKAEKSSENLRCPKSQQSQLQLSNSTVAAREEAHAEAVAATS